MHGPRLAWASLAATTLLLVGPCGCARSRHVEADGASAARTERVELVRDGWRLVGDLATPVRRGAGRAPVALLLNRAAGTRAAYDSLAAALARQGVASLRLDLSAHGESINLGRFVPGAPMPPGADAAADVRVALDYLRRHRSLDAMRVAVVGASYSGEAAVQAAQQGAAALAYAFLSPGSLSDSSIAYLNARPGRWLYIASRTERSASVQRITLAVRAAGGQADILELAGPVAHATDLLAARPELVETLAAWLRVQLAVPASPAH